MVNFLDLFQVNKTHLEPVFELPMRVCASGKRPYSSESIAVEALIETHVHFDYGKRNGPVAVYVCDDCGQYHLTSRGPINAKLDQCMKDGTLEKLRKAAQWINKWR